MSVAEWCAVVGAALAVGGLLGRMIGATARADAIHAEKELALEKRAAHFREIFYPMADGRAEEAKHEFLVRNINGTLDEIREDQKRHGVKLDDLAKQVVDFELSCPLRRERIDSKGGLP